MADYILTYTKTKFYPLEPIKDDIKIEDIAHSLSQLARVNGHFEHFYSVGHHAINCCKEAKMRGYTERVQLGCLLHDASESYISDLTRPVKKNLPEYFIIEEKLQRTIYDKFGLGDLSAEEQDMIRDVDDTLLDFEFEALMDVHLFDMLPTKLMMHDFSQRDFKNVENEFLYLFNRLTKAKSHFSCVGIDGCRDGWVAVNITDRDFEVEVFRSIEEICSKYSDSDCMIVDMPIGLPECTDDIRPDAEARAVLSSRSSCIFNTPCRQAVYEDDYHQANYINREVLGKGLSTQSFAICGSIREIDLLLEKRPELKNKLLESHPEVCFAMLNSEGQYKLPIFENKKTEEGMDKRVSLLAQYYDKTEDVMKHMLDDPKLCRMKDDVIDALCLAVTGMLGIRNSFGSIPEEPVKDIRGIKMQMVFAEADAS